MANCMQLEIVTPDKLLFSSDEIVYLGLRTNDGGIGIEANHIPDDIDKARAEAAKDRAEERLKNKTENLDVNRAQYSLRRAIARLGAYNKLGR